jgi:hypothetical protein
MDISLTNEISSIWYMWRLAVYNNTKVLSYIAMNRISIIINNLVKNTRS